MPLRLDNLTNGPLAQARQLDFPAMFLLGVVLVSLGIAYGVGIYLQRQPESALNPAVVKTFNQRVRAWWMLYAILGGTFLLQTLTQFRVFPVLFFFAISFWALREFITLTPTRLGDHRPLFSVFFIFAPLQYALVGLSDWPTISVFGFDTGIIPERLFTSLIPVYGFLYIPAHVALAGDHRRFLERTAKIQCGLLICVYALSHAPALLYLDLVSAKGPWLGGNVGLLLFFIIVVQMGDVFQFVWSHLLGKRVIAPGINANRTWEGFIGGALSAMVVGMLLYGVTPFSPLQAALMSLLLAVMGAAGSMTMSAIKRDRGVEDYGTLVEGHVGVLDRFDSMCFAAPVFFHITRFLFT